MRRREMSAFILPTFLVYFNCTWEVCAKVRYWSLPWPVSSLRTHFCSPHLLSSPSQKEEEHRGLTAEGPWEAPVQVCERQYSQMWQKEPDVLVKRRGLGGVFLGLCWVARWKYVVSQGPWELPRCHLRLPLMWGAGRDQRKRVGGSFKKQRRLTYEACSGRGKMCRSRHLPTELTALRGGLTRLQSRVQPRCPVPRHARCPWGSFWEQGSQRELTSQGQRRG